MEPRPESGESVPAPIAGDWRWDRLAIFGGLAGAVSTATATTALAGVVQITQVGNELTSSSNNLNADLTGDGVPDLPNLSVFFTTSKLAIDTSYGIWQRVARAYAWSSTFGTSTGTGSATLKKVFGKASHFEQGPLTTGGNPGSATASDYNVLAGEEGVSYEPTPQTRSAMVPVSFTDTRINGGAETNGLLEVLAFNTSKTEHAVRFVRLVFDDADTAQPAGIVAGGSEPEFVPAVHALQAARAEQIARLRNQINRLNRQIRQARAKQRQARAAGRIAQVKREGRKIRRYVRTIRQRRASLNALLANPV